MMVGPSHTSLTRSVAKVLGGGCLARKSTDVVLSPQDMGVGEWVVLTNGKCVGNGEGEGWVLM